MSGFEVNEETLAFDVLKEVGINGNFIGESHTVEHIEDSYWPSQIFERFDFDAWANGGKKTALDRAHEYVEDVTKGYQSMEPVIEPSKYEELKRIRRAAAEEMGVDVDKYCRD